MGEKSSHLDSNFSFIAFLKNFTQDQKHVLLGMLASGTISEFSKKKSHWLGAVIVYVAKIPNFGRGKKKQSQAT
jgi:hypothetical protein